MFPIIEGIAGSQLDTREKVALEVKNGKIALPVLNNFEAVVMEGP